ncbi:MAG: tyrosinase family protein [Okeania sp. SIO3I5]|nr:tyrosinase family protein [Okeania sp. SIO3I5]
MSTFTGPRVRYSVRQLQAEYDEGKSSKDLDKMKPLEDLIRAWKGIKELPPEDPNSFFCLGGYHGEPFVYRDDVDNLKRIDSYVYWGGYCNHGNVLFPTWHRVYVLKLEKALQTIVPDVMMPYWDQTTLESLKKGIPDILTQEKFTFSDAQYNGELAGKTIDNPLRSFVLPKRLSDKDYEFDGNPNYSKPKGYETVRYPLSGLVGTPKDREATKKHNDQYPDPIMNIKLLNTNVKQWLNGIPPEKPVPETPEAKFSIYKRYEKCLNAPNYTVFSNTTSAMAWNRGSHQADVVIPLENPHNDIHLSVGGFDYIEGSEEIQIGIIAGANGDMGENNTAALDPIFFFHHCNVDRMFWLWQKKHNYTDKLTIIPGYPGTSSTDSQGPTPDFPPNASLNLDSPLYPFRKIDDKNMEVPYTSKDCINIEKQLNYTYSSGSFDHYHLLDEQKVQEETRDEGFSKKKLVVTGIDRALFQGSFVLQAYANFEGKKYYLGHYSVFSRRNVVKCANCLTHLEVQAFFPLDKLPASAVDNNEVEYSFTFRHRGPQLHQDLKYDWEIID